MSFSMNKLRSLLPGAASTNTATQQRPSVSLEPEIGFQITIETMMTTPNATDVVPALNVHLMAARHLPALFGFKVVQGYLIKVKLFPGSKRLDSTIQTNSWPKFNENFKFPLTPDIKPSLKHSSRRGSKTVGGCYTPEDLFAGQFVVFTVYALLQLPPASFNRFNKTYRSLRDKSSNLVLKVVESSSSKSKDDKENSKQNDVGRTDSQNTKRKTSEVNPRDAMPPLTISESRRNIGSVTCYLESKLFKRSSRTGMYSTEELWLPIKDITTTVAKGPHNNLANSTKGVVELALEVRDLSESVEVASSEAKSHFNTNNSSPPGPTKETHPLPTCATTASNASLTNGRKNPQWNRMTTDVKRKMGINSSSSKTQHHNLVLRVTTARMRCSNKSKDELEATAGTVYVKTTVFEHGIYMDAWKSANFYPSLSTKWEIVGGEAPTLNIPLQTIDSLDNILIRTTLATKTKMGKKIVLGTVIVGGSTEHMQLLHETPTNERVCMWHSYK